MASNAPQLPQGQYFTQAAQPAQTIQTTAPPAPGAANAAAAAALFAPSLGQSAQQSPLGAPPTNSNEREENTNRWEEFLSSLEQPGVTDAVLTFGAQLMQPRAPGQTVAGHTGASLMQGLGVLRSEQSQAEKQKLLEREVGAKEKTAAASETAAQAQLEGVDVARTKAEAELEHRKAQAATAQQKYKLDAAELALKRDEYRLAVKELAAKNTLTPQKMFEMAQQQAEKQVEANTERNALLDPRKDTLLPTDINIIRGEVLQSIQREAILAVEETQLKDFYAKNQNPPYDSYLAAPPEIQAQIDVAYNQRRKAAQTEEERLRQEGESRQAEIQAELDALAAEEKQTAAPRVETLAEKQKRQAAETAQKATGEVPLKETYEAFKGLFKKPER